MRESPSKGTDKFPRSWLKNWLPGTVNKTRAYYERAGRPGGHVYPFLKTSMLRFVEMRGMESAAGLAYYALFSLFPLTLILVSLAGYVLGSELAYSRVVSFIRSVLPFSGDVLDQNLKEVVELRGPVGIIGFLAMLWSTLGYFNTLSNSINRAWPMVKLRSYVQDRLVALGMIGVLLLLLVLSLISSTLINLFPTLILTLDIDVHLPNWRVWEMILRIVPALFTILMFMAMYRWVPNKTVHWRAVLPGAAITAFAWELAKQAFSMYLGSGIARYEMVYGSLGALIALMLWIYLNNLIALFGAYLVASLDLLVDQEVHAAQAARSDEKPVIQQEERIPGAAVFSMPEAALAVDFDNSGRVETHPPKRVHG